MFAEERRDTIINELMRLGRVEVTELAARLSVSEDTIRRDLRALEAQGYLQKTHGGAVALDTPHLSWAVRSRVVPQAKASIAAAAARLIEPGNTVIVDAGSTTLEIARRIPTRLGGQPITVITNSLDIAAALEAQPGINLIVTGGEWNPHLRHLVGPSTLECLRRHRADLVFLGTCAVHPRAGVTATYPPDAEVKRAMIESANRAVLLADHTKIGEITPHLVAPLEAIDTIITDAESDTTALETAGAKVMMARASD